MITERPNLAEKEKKPAILYLDSLYLLESKAIFQ